ncbi:hypothetical protein CPC08DRAFT_704802 [Agrocybe pediades]|nr:hypothetical protein CPC08DRAFT_704802 [Agrocybe pediades]
MDDVFGATSGLAAKDQQRQDAIYRRLGLINDSKEMDDRKSDEESQSEKREDVQLRE